MKTKHRIIKIVAPKRRTTCAGYDCLHYRGCNPFGSRSYCNAGHKGLEFIDEMKECWSFELKRELK